MTNIVLKRSEISEYFFLKNKIYELDIKIKEVESEIEEVNKYDVNISPHYTGMPSGNEKRDKIADYIIRLDSDRRRLSILLATLFEERNDVGHKLFKIRKSVSQIADEETRKIITGYYFEGVSISKIAKQLNLSNSTVYKKLDSVFAPAGESKRRVISRYTKLSISKLSDEQWELVRPIFKRSKGAHLSRYDTRELIDAVLFLLNYGVQWHLLPICYPPHDAVRMFYVRAIKNGKWDKAMEILEEVNDNKN